jgi:hypothetical protein
MEYPALAGSKKIYLFFRDSNGQAKARILSFDFAQDGELVEPCLEIVDPDLAGLDTPATFVPI